MQTILRVKDIKLFTHEFIEYICISIYFFNIAKNDFLAFTFITKEFHLINDSKVKMLIENHFFKSEKFIIDIERKIANIDNCNINIGLEIQSKSSYIRKTIHVQHAIVLQSNHERFISIKVDTLEKRDFLFQFDSNANLTIHSHILDIIIKKFYGKK